MQQNATLRRALRKFPKERAPQKPSVLKRSVPKALAFAFGSRLRSKRSVLKRVFLGGCCLMESPKRGCDLGTC